MFLRKRKSEDKIPNLSTPKGFEQVYRTYVAKLCRIAANQVSDVATAQSIVQNVFSTLWERRDSLMIEGPIENYLVRAVKLKVMEHLRAQSIRRERLKDFLADYRPASQCTEYELDYHELLTQVNQLTEQLPSQCRRVYRLSREQGLNNKEIASTLLIAEKTVEAHLTKALAYLRRNLTDYTFIMLLMLG
ncbi:MAG: RNA polymerase sigma-70 factor [Bacteroidota bacterium]